MLWCRGDKPRPVQSRRVSFCGDDRLSLRMLGDREHWRDLLSPQGRSSRQGSGAFLAVRHGGVGAGAMKASPPAPRTQASGPQAPHLQGDNNLHLPGVRSRHGGALTPSLCATHHTHPRPPQGRHQGPPRGPVTCLSSQPLLPPCDWALGILMPWEEVGMPPFPSLWPFSQRKPVSKGPEKKATFFQFVVSFIYLFLRCYLSI